MDKREVGNLCSAWNKKDAFISPRSMTWQCLDLGQAILGANAMLLFKDANGRRKGR